MNPIRESLARFLTDPTLRVAVIKGEWGIGKTFFWRKFFEEKKSSLANKAYSYVSLFGARDIGDLRKQIFSNCQILNDKSISKHLEKLKPLRSILETVDIPYLNSSGSITDLIESKLVENFLICFDDLERKEASISASSVLGLISTLKEEKDCKIILIYNDQELDEATKKEINEYREKVVDLELTYRPTITDNLAIIWPEGYPVSVQKIFEELKLNNIRIMQRVRWTLEYFDASILRKYESLAASFEHKCAVLTVLHHGFRNQVTIEEAISTNYYSLLLSKDDEEKDRFQVLKTLHFMPEEQDQIIVDYLINGYVDLASYSSLLEANAEKNRISNVNNEHHALWTEYHSGFVTEQDSFITRQIEFVEKHIEDLGLKDVAATLDFIKELDPDRSRDDLLERSIAIFVEKVDDVRRRDLTFHRLKPEVIKKIEEGLAHKTKEYPISQLFFDLAGSDSWSPSKIQHMKRFSEADYFQWITTEKEKDTPWLLKEFLQRFGSQNEDEELVVSRIRSALSRIKERSAIDRCRVQYLIEGRKTD
jgi:hypothetical protein